MTREEALHYLYDFRDYVSWDGMPEEALDVAIKALEQEPTTKNDLGVDCISRDDVRDVMQELWGTSGELMDRLMALPSVTPQEPKTGHCRDCKWWKDSDGVYRRGVRAESQCPINRKEVFEGNGYCYMFEPQESEG